jgi:hypothetical protein
MSEKTNRLGDPGSLEKHARPQSRTRIGVLSSETFRTYARKIGLKSGNFKMQ